MLKRRGTPSPLGLARAAPLGFSRKKKGSAAFTLFSLFLFLFFSSSLHPLVFFIQLSSSFFSFSFFELLLEKKNPKKNRKTSEKRNFRRNLALFLYSTFSYLSPIFLSFLCGEFFPFFASRLPPPFFLLLFILLSAFWGLLCIFCVCVCAVKGSAGLVWFCVGFAALPFVWYGTAWW